MITATVLRLARLHVADNKVMESSARLCLADAVRLYDACDPDGARLAAVRSLRYSVGILSPVFIAVMTDGSLSTVESR